mmetsp:Transcript_47052/g.54235  ORF Transcript_47052/g.54235 Transcript_47052/m.54235 type:complete len:106 (+) Transcript_47052:619-936(+)
MFEDPEQECITVDTLKRIAKEVDEDLNDEEVMYMMKFADANNDGKINLVEFQEIIFDLFQSEQQQASFDTSLNDTTMLNESTFIDDPKKPSPRKKRSKRREKESN